MPNNAACYGSNYCGDIVCAATSGDSSTIRPTRGGDDLSPSRAAARLNAYLAAFDLWDRYDIDGDGNFDEPDGYIDHFQSVHAGEGEETGGGALGADAIWSHRWYAYFHGPIGPDGAGPNAVRRREDRRLDYWIGDYTVEPENGGVGVFAHEFGHDLDLPDLYDTSGNTGGAENSHRLLDAHVAGLVRHRRHRGGIGGNPVHMGTWEKFQLGLARTTRSPSPARSRTHRSARPR